MDTRGRGLGRLGLLVAVIWWLQLPGAVWHVRSDGVEGGDGRSWPAALTSLERALEVASAGDSIWVSGGTFEPTALRPFEGEEAFGASFALKDGVSIYGGFRGDERSLGDRRLKPDGIYGWSFEHETVLRQKEGQLGGVLRGPASGLEKGCELNGLVIEGGRALGTYEEGLGGGVYGHGRLTVSCCLLRGNVARSGGGIWWEGALTMMCVGLYDNDLVAEGWSGLGGGGMLVGDGYRLTGVVCTGNGTVLGGVQSGGGLYLGGSGVASHCTVVGNRTSRNGSGVWLAEGSKLENALVWGNSGRLSQVVLDGGSTATCGIECWSREDTGDIPLLGENCGPGGIEANDNWVDGYYPCFRSVENRDFRLAGGSYGVNRGGSGVVDGLDAHGMPLAESFPADLGACGSRLKGNLALDFSVEHPHLYGGESQLLVYVGMGSPAGIATCFLGDERSVALEELAPGEWGGSWLRTGQTDLELQADVMGVEASYWHGFDLTKRLAIKPRPLLVSATDVDYRHGSGEPELEWSIAAGRLVLGDRLVGKLACDYEGQLGARIPITQGSLAVEDGNGGRNYRLSFLAGELTYGKGLAEVAVTGDDATYDAQPLDLTVTTAPAGLDLTVTYEGRDGTAYGPSETPPTDAGAYTARIEIRDERYEGVLDVPVVIGKAILTATAEDKRRLYGEENPPLTIRYEGFAGGDDASCLSPPVAQTEAGPWSPVKEGGYDILLSGGESRNYELRLASGRLLVGRGHPDAGVVAGGEIEYGETVADAALTSSGNAVPGTFQWSHPDAAPGAGDSPQPWVFTPDDDANWESVRGTATVRVLPRKITVALGQHEGVYGDAPPDFQVQIVSGSLVPGDRFSGQPVCEGGLGAGEHVIGAGTLSLGKNYDLTVQPGSMLIARRAVTLKAVDAMKGVGEEDPELRWQVVAGSLAPGESPTGSLARAAGEAAGSYEIGQGSLELSGNYELSFVAGRLTIIELVPVLDAAGVVAGGIRYGDSLSASVLSGKVRHPGTGEELAGTFAWDAPDTCPDSGVSRHRWHFVPAANNGRMSPLRGDCEVMVSPAVLEVRVADTALRRPYFSEQTRFALTYQGFVNGDGVADLLLEPEAETDAGLTSPVGRYPVRIRGGLARNYRFQYVDCELEVVKALPQELDPVRLPALVYGMPFDRTMATATFVPPAPISDIMGQLEFPEVADGSLLPAGGHALTWRFVPLDENFEILEGTVILEVLRAPLVVRADDVTIHVDEELPASYGFSCSGFVNGEDADSAHVNLASVRTSCEAVTTYFGGTYPIRLTMDTGGCDNYDIAVEEGTLTVVRATPVPRGMDRVVICYGDDLPAMRTQSGLVWFMNDFQGHWPLYRELNKEIILDGDSLNMARGGFPTIRRCHFEGIIKDDFIPRISGVLHWDWKVELPPVGTYENVPWRFVPEGRDAMRYGEATGVAMLEVCPKPLLITPPRLEYLRGNRPDERLLWNEDWTFDESALVNGDRVTGRIYCGQLGRNLDDIERYAMNEKNVRPALDWYLDVLSVSEHYQPYCHRDYYHVVTIARRHEVLWEDYRGDPGIPDDFPVFGTRLLNGEDRSGRTWEVTGMPQDLASDKVKLPYEVPEPYILGGNVVAHYSFPEDSYPKHYFRTDLPVVDVLSRTIDYGSPLPEPEFAVKFSDTLTEEDVVGAPEYVNVSMMPGSYVISRGSLRMADPSQRVAFCDGVLTIRRRRLTLRTGACFKCEGAADPVPSYEIVGGSLLPGDELTGELSREPGESRGLYRYTPGTLSHPCYEIELTEDSVLSISKPWSRDLDDTGISRGTLLFGERLESVRLEDSVRKVGTGEVVPGTLRFMLPHMTLPVGQHWVWGVFHYHEGTEPTSFATRTLVTVLPRELTVVADNHRIAWGDPLPALGYRLAEGQLEDGLSGSLRAVPRDEWHYDITLGDLSGGEGIALTLQAGSVVNVHRRPLVLEVMNSRKAAGEADPPFRYRIASGSLAPGDSLQGVAFSREPGEGAGEYSVSMSLAGTSLDPDLSHYDLEVVTGILEVVEASASPVSSQSSKVVVNGAWSEGVAAGEKVSWGGGEYVYGVNGFSDLEAGLAAVRADGVVLIAPGVYESSTGSWFVDRGVSLIGDDEGDVDSEIILLGGLQTSDNRVSKLLLSNLSLVSGRDHQPAITLADNVGGVVMVNCRVVGGETAVLTGAYGNGVSVIYSEISAVGCCLRGELGTGQSAPLSPLTLVCNIFEGGQVLDVPGFSVISSSNLHNGASMEDLSQ